MKMGNERLLNLLFLNSAGLGLMMNSALQQDSFTLKDCQTRYRTR